ncbi:unnamed protein product (macronuclear) [Paramecium tetraurelia]|uniref:Uncharacterized protein n=1 Tax=Paramecium tetraurelia TaxID=5888 RepID=A0D578_PARTE|nr:uncharacterized protein GSPATT00013642001 [Paramecium tetraurelia]CAK78195.1 unnamed protein product [Paramecium tetraurelia]|eukprot:XP_001445592.1 hypothetical protein (macronuclear) [Paramecium tetraurelia strain d4-2]
MSKQIIDLLQNNRSNWATKIEQFNQYETGYLQQALKQFSSHHSQSISPIRSLNDLSIDNKLGFNGSPNISNADQQIGALIQEIEKQNISIKLKTQQIQECHSKISQIELHYGLKIEDLETQHLYQIQLSKSQLQELQQENANLINLINQLKSQQDQQSTLIEQINTENNQLTEQMRKFQMLNSIQSGDMNVDSNSNQYKQEIMQIKQQMIKLNKVIQDLEEQNKNYEVERNKYFKENHDLINLKNILTQQLEVLKIEDLQLQEENKELLDKMNKTKEQFNISQKQILYQLKQEQIEKQQLLNQYQRKVHELQTISSQLESRIQETLQGSSQINQFSSKISSLEQQEHDLQNLIEHQKTQITQQRKTISLLEQNLQNSQNTEIQYQQLLQSYNNIKEQLYQSSISEHNGNNNQQLIQQQLLTSQKQCQEQQNKIEKLSVMLKNRLNEIELWKNKCYENNLYENRQIFEQLKQENEILRQKCNILEINIKENNNLLYSQEITKLNQIIKQQQDKIIHQQQILEQQKKQLGSPKSQKAFTTEMNTKDFNSKNKRN